MTLYDSDLNQIPVFNTDFTTQGDMFYISTSVLPGNHEWANDWYRESFGTVFQSKRNLFIKNGDKFYQLCGCRIASISNLVDCYEIEIICDYFSQIKIPLDLIRDRKINDILD